jgi:UDP-glucose 4-epimerase
MRIAITGATGNVGTALVRALVADPAVDSIVGLARRVPQWQPAKTSWVQADVTHTDLRPHFEGADAVVHLAWLIQPSRDTAITDAVNIDGSRRVFEATAQAGVPALIHASSVAAYSPAKLIDPVDESWSTHGIPSSYYSRQKVAVERILDDVQSRHPGLRVARARPGLIFQRSAASEIRRYFAGPLVPGWLARRSLIPFVPQLSNVGGQIVHADDVAQLYRLLCINADATGAFNVAANPPLDAEAIARLLGARPLRLPTAAVRAMVQATWRARLHPVSADWLDIAANVPVMLTDRAQTELGWQPLHDPGDVLLELFDGLRAGAGFDTPPLASHAGGRLRVREFLTGVGGPNPLDRRSGAGPDGAGAKPLAR